MRSNDNKLDILVIAVHPDDAELGCAGTILKHIAEGKKVGIVDLTQGELGTRGTVETRYAEAAEASRILGLSARENLKMRDGFFKNDEAHQLQVISVIRKYQPKIIIANAMVDRHPDHGRASNLVNDSVFLAGLKMIETQFNGENQEPHRPDLLLHFIQDYYIQPDIVVDITPYLKQKLKAVQAYKTQFFNEDYKADEPETYISKPGFIQLIEGRAREFGKSIHADFGEGFTCRRILGVDSLFSLK
jgi:bacillithiol biosynthesis deacetylase BshB1